MSNKHQSGFDQNPVNCVASALQPVVDADIASSPGHKILAFKRFSKHKREAGFSLLEILVAFSILAIALGVLLNIFSGGLRSAIVSEEYQQALAIAESQLARVGVDIILEDGVLQGVEQDKFNWSIQAGPFELPKAEGATDQQGTQQMRAYKVQVKVEWEEGQDNRSVVLNTVRLAKVSL